MDKLKLQLEDPNKLEQLKRRRQVFFRVNIFFFCTFVVFSILVVRLALLQFVEAKQLSEAESFKTIRPVPIPPIRGNIYDSTGHPVAISTSSHSLFFRLERNQKRDEVERLAEELAAVFAQYGDPERRVPTAEDIIRSMDLNSSQHYMFYPRRIKSGLTQQEIAYFMENRDQFRWIEIVEESMRSYPNPIAVQTVGYLRQYSVAINRLSFYRRIEENSDSLTKYLDTENVGFDGIELMFQEELRGQNGLRRYQVNSAGQVIGQESYDPPEKGNNVHLTIHKDVQKETEEAILNHLDYLRSNEARTRNMHAPHALTGYAVAIEVKTGRVVAMASMPDYDPLIWRGGISQDNYDTYQYFFKNGTISESYPPYPDDRERARHASSLVPLGSVIKPLTILLGLEEKLLTPTERYNDVGIFHYGRNNAYTIRNSNSRAWGSINAFQAIRHSSNTFMAALVGHRLAARGQEGLTAWDTYMKAFGLGIQTGSGLPGEISGIREYETEAVRSSVQSALVFASWGQGGRYTTLQLAQFAATLGSKGKRMRPLLVDRISSYDGTTVKTFESEVLDETPFDNVYWDIIDGSMELVTRDGNTGLAFRDVPYRIASKTGTSEQDVAGGIRVNNAVFIAYGPIEDPKLAVAVVVPEGGFGANGAAPIASQIFQSYDRHVGLMAP